MGISIGQFGNVTDRMVADKEEEAKRRAEVATTMAQNNAKIAPPAIPQPQMPTTEMGEDGVRRNIGDMQATGQARGADTLGADGKLDGGRNVYYGSKMAHYDKDGNITGWWDSQSGKQIDSPKSMQMMQNMGGMSNKLAAWAAMSNDQRQAKQVEFQKNVGQGISAAIGALSQMSGKTQSYDNGSGFRQAGSGNFYQVAKLPNLDGINEKHMGLGIKTRIENMIVYQQCDRNGNPLKDSQLKIGIQYRKNGNVADGGQVYTKSLSGGEAAKALADAYMADGMSETEAHREVVGMMQGHNPLGWKDVKDMPSVEQYRAETERMIGMKRIDDQRNLGVLEVMSKLGVKGYGTKDEVKGARERVDRGQFIRNVMESKNGLELFGVWDTVTDANGRPQYDPATGAPQRKINFIGTMKNIEAFAMRNGIGGFAPANNNVQQVADPEQEKNRQIIDQTLTSMGYNVEPRVAPQSAPNSAPTLSAESQQKVDAAQQGGATAEQVQQELAKRQAAKQQEAPAATQSINGKTVVVKDGEDLMSIAVSNNIAPSAILDANNIEAGDWRSIKPGQQLVIPAANNNNVIRPQINGAANPAQSTATAPAATSQEDAIKLRELRKQYQDALANQDFKKANNISDMMSPLEAKEQNDQEMQSYANDNPIVTKEGMGADEAARVDAQNNLGTPGVHKVKTVDQDGNPVTLQINSSFAPPKGWSNEKERGYLKFMKGLHYDMKKQIGGEKDFDYRRFYDDLTNAGVKSVADNGGMTLELARKFKDNPEMRKYYNPETARKYDEQKARGEDAYQRFHSANDTIFKSNEQKLRELRKGYEEALAKQDYKQAKTISDAMTSLEGIDMRSDEEIAAAKRKKANDDINMEASEFVDEMNGIKPRSKKAILKEADDFITEMNRKVPTR